MKPKITITLLCLLGLIIANLYSQSVNNLMQQANLLYKQNNYSSAQEKYLQVIKEAENNNNMAVAKASMNLAYCYYYLYDYTSSFKWSYRALNYSKKYNYDSLFSAANYFLGALYIEAAIIDSAEKYSYKAIELARKVKDFALVSNTYSTLVELHLNTSKNPKIIEHLIFNAEDFAKKSGNKTMLAFAYSKRYNYAFFLKKNYQEALKYINKAEQLYLEIGNREAILNSYRGKAECLIMLKDTTALPYMLQWFRFKDSVLQAEKVANVVKYETLYESEKKDKENKILKQKNELNKLFIIIILAGFLLLVLLGLWLWNKNNLQKKEIELRIFQDQQKEKERIARDLHDNVGGQLSFIIYTLEGINDKELDTRIQLTETISKSVRNIINSLRETIWAISDSHISIIDFSDKLKVFSKTLFKHKEITINFTEDLQHPKELNALLGLNLFRICQEILNNAFKHSHASEIHIQLISKIKNLVITITDNGIGFDTTLQNKGKYGLQNIKERAKEFGIEIKLLSEINKGSQYELLV